MGDAAMLIVPSAILRRCVHPTSDPVRSSPPPLPRDADWHALPPQSVRLAAAGGALTMGATLALAASGSLLALAPRLWWLIPILALAGAFAGGWLAAKRQRLTRWRLDADGLALRHGRWWQTETRVPVTRVQHLDLRRGPLERIAGLTTLVVHTAGTRLNAVAIAGLDQHDAERLRDRLARQLDHDDDAL